MCTSSHLVSSAPFVRNLYVYPRSPSDCSSCYDETFTSYLSGPKLIWFTTSILSQPHSSFTTHCTYPLYQAGLVPMAPGVQVRVFWPRGSHHWAGGCLHWDALITPRGHGESTLRLSGLKLCNSNMNTAFLCLLEFIWVFYFSIVHFPGEHQGNMEHFVRNEAEGATDQSSIWKVREVRTSRWDWKRRRSYGESLGQFNRVRMDGRREENSRNFAGNYH